MSPRNPTLKCLPKTNGKKYIHTEIIQMFISTSFTVVPARNNSHQLESRFRKVVYLHNEILLYNIKQNYGYINY